MAFVSFYPRTLLANIPSSHDHYALRMYLPSFLCTKSLYSQGNLRNMEGLYGF